MGLINYRFFAIIFACYQLILLLLIGFIGHQSSDRIALIIILSAFLLLGIKKIRDFRKSLAVSLVITGYAFVGSAYNADAKFILIDVALLFIPLIMNFAAAGLQFYKGKQRISIFYAAFMFNLACIYYLYESDLKSFLDPGGLLVLSFLVPPYLGLPALMFFILSCPDIFSFKVAFLILSLFHLSRVAPRLKSVVIFAPVLMVPLSWHVVMMSPEFWLLDVAGGFTNSVSVTARFNEFSTFYNKDGFEFWFGSGLGFAFDLDWFRSISNIWSFNFAVWQDGGRARVNHYAFTFLGNRFGYIALIFISLSVFYFFLRVIRKSVVSDAFLALSLYFLIEVSLNIANGLSSLLLFFIIFLMHDFRRTFTTESKARVGAVEGVDAPPPLTASQCANVMSVEVITEAEDIYVASYHHRH